MEFLVRGKFVLTRQERFGPDGIIPDGAVTVSGKEIAEVGRYKDPLLPFHRVNSIK